MGDLGIDTAVTKVDEARYTATLSREWEIWGPMGGYIASVALRAAGAESTFPRPASFFCQYLGVASFDAPIELAVSTLRSARTALAQRVEVTQDGKRMLEATVWSVGDVDGLEHDVAERPPVAAPDELKTLPEVFEEHGIEPQGTFAFWQNIESKPTAFNPVWPPPEPVPPVWQEWCRFVPASTFEDPWIDACRSLILIDVQSWPSASRAHVHGAQHGFYAPSLDLYVAFADPQPGEQWLLCDGFGPVAKHGLMTWNGRLWSPEGRLVATGEGQLLCRRMPGSPS
jgi:acyl-CoA thioesterase-2